MPQDRYQSATEFIADIQNVLEFRPIKAKRLSVILMAYRMLRRNPLKIVALTASILVPILGYSLLSVHMQEKERATLTKLYEQGRDRVEGERYEEALSYFQKVAKVTPQNAELNYYMADCHRLLGQYEKAIEAYSAAIKIRPHYANAYWGLGDCYKKTKRYQEAVGSFKQAIQADPNDAYTYSDLGDLYAKLGRYQEAIEYCTQACKLSEYKNRDYIATLAVAYAESGDFEKAIEYQRKALDLADEQSKIEYAKRLEGYKAHKPWRE